MISHPDRVRALWTALAGAAVEFPAPGRVTAVVAPGSLMCPSGWLGIVVLDGAGIATVPDRSWVEPVSALPAEVAADPAALRARLPVLDVLGPATLAYLDPAEFRPAPDRVETVAAAALESLLWQAGPEDADESGLAGIESPAFIVRAGDGIAAAAGYRVWLGIAAHLCVLTAPAHRDRGLARAVASAAVAHALDADLLPQWRARPPASRRVAAALGFRERGTQVSVRLAEPGDRATPH